MSEKIYFSNMFPDYEPPEALIGALSQAAIVAADIDPATREVTTALFMEQYVPKRLLDQVSKELTQMYGLSKIELVATYPETELPKIEPEELRDLFVAQNSMTRGTLAGAKWTWQGRELHIQLLANGKKELEEIVPYVQRSLREQFATPVTIHIEADTEENNHAALAKIRQLGAKAAISLKPGTSAEAALPYLQEVDMILVMTVEPGFGGQKFMADMMPKLKTLKEMTASTEILLAVDGGVDSNTHTLCKENGAEMLVAGSAYFKAADRKAFVDLIQNS